MSMPGMANSIGLVIIMFYLQRAACLGEGWDVALYRGLRALSLGFLQNQATITVKSACVILYIFDPSHSSMKQGSCVTP